MPSGNSFPPRKAPGPRPLTESTVIAALAKRAHQLDLLDARLRQSLPAPLNEQLRLAGIRGRSAVLLTPNPAWATRARAAQSSILAALHAVGVDADSIIVKVKLAPALHAQVQTVVATPLSPTAATHLRAAAKTVPDPELRALFLDLASVAERDCSS